METALIKLTAPGTMKLLKELEAMKLLLILKTEHSEELHLSEKYAGKLPLQVAEKLQDHIENSRNEWNNNI
ncbi:MAG: hypothetical protein WC271_10420 [Bacteroidales bacterium]|jgi:hypothetical protein|nr:hypothetical protein [Bacteroidales bacterium]NLO49676.1 hypothetical protein [Bacteroidales bacterium]